MLTTSLSNLKVGDKFIINEPAYLSTANGYIYKLPINDENIFTVVKVNKITIEAICNCSNDSLLKYRNRKNTFTFKYNNIDTSHVRDRGEDILVNVVG